MRINLSSKPRMKGPSSTCTYGARIMFANARATAAHVIRLSRSRTASFVCALFFRRYVMEAKWVEPSRQTITEKQKNSQSESSILPTCAWVVPMAMKSQIYSVFVMYALVSPCYTPCEGVFASYSCIDGKIVGPLFFHVNKNHVLKSFLTILM